MKKQLHYIDTYFTFRFVSEKLGRRNALIVNSALSVIGCYLQFITKPTKLPEFMFVGRFLLGINLGLGSGLVSMYLMEITPTRHCGRAATTHQVFTLY